jgi:dynein heavy chain
VEFREDLKALYIRLGCEDKRMTFLFTDAHIVHDGFLEFVNNMLTIGIVPALFGEDEKEGIIAPLREQVRNKYGTDAKERCWAYFVDRCRDNLHIVLAMSPVGDWLRVRCRNFPGMVNNCSIDWLTPWPEEALLSVAHKFIEDLQLGADHQSVVLQMTSMHETVRRSPRSATSRLFAPSALHSRVRCTGWFARQT